VIQASRGMNCMYKPRLGRAGTASLLVPGLHAAGRGVRVTGGGMQRAFGDPKNALEERFTVQPQVLGSTTVPWANVPLTLCLLAALGGRSLIGIQERTHKHTRAHTCTHKCPVPHVLACPCTCTQGLLACKNMCTCRGDAPAQPRALTPAEGCAHTHRGVQSRVRVAGRQQQPYVCVPRANTPLLLPRAAHTRRGYWQAAICCS